MDDEEIQIQHTEVDLDGNMDTLNTQNTKKSAERQKFWGRKKSSFMQASGQRSPPSISVREKWPEY